MRLEFLDRMKGDEVLGKNILTSDGKILLRAGVVVREEYIRKLKEIGVHYVYIEDDRLDDVIVEDERLSEIKQILMKNMFKIVKNISYDMDKNLQSSFKAIEDLTSYIVQIGDVNKSLYDIKTYDNYTYVHCIDTCIMSTFLGKSIGYKEDMLTNLGVSALLHDIGKTQIDCSIINKNGPLTNEEYEEVKMHPIYGAELLKKNVCIPDSVIKAVLQHHERVDGNGYPNRLEGKGISELAKIICVCDVYDAVSNDRIYRKKFSPQDAYELILAGNCSAFDEKIVKCFKQTFSVYPLGCCVRLSNNVEGYVVGQNINFPDRPIVRVLYDSSTKNSIPIYEIDLLSESNLVISGVV